MRLTVLFSVLLFITSCSTFRSTGPQSFGKKAKEKVIPEKVFSYAYQQPSRSLVTPAIAKLFSGNKFGRAYFSASGYECKKYSASSGQLSSACKIGKRWYTASPVFLAH